MYIVVDDNAIPSYWNHWNFFILLVNISIQNLIENMTALESFLSWTSHMNIYY